MLWVGLTPPSDSKGVKTHIEPKRNPRAMSGMGAGPKPGHAEGASVRHILSERLERGAFSPLGC